MTYYDVLGIKNSAKEDEIKTAYHQMIIAFHPDIYQGNKEFAKNKTQEIITAYKVLSDPSKKQVYDETLYNGVTRHDDSMCQENSYATSSDKTHTSEDTHKNSSNSSQQRKTNDVGRYKKALFVIGLIFLFLIGVFLSEYNPNPPSTPKSTPTMTPTPLAMPASGTIFTNTIGTGDCPFKVLTSGNGGYYIKIANKYDTSKILTFFINGGDKIEKVLPTGTYVVKYASGQSWYGEKEFFGNNTTYSKCDTDFKFYTDSSYAYGSSITLYTVSNGNMETETISEAEF